MSVYKRGRIWWVRFQVAGETVRRTSRSRRRRSAEAFEAELREEYARLRRTRRSGKTFNDLIKRYELERYPPWRRDGRQRFKYCLNVLRPHFEGVPLEDIDHARLAEFVALRGASVKTGTVRRDLSCLQVTLGAAVAWGWIEHNLVRTFNKRAIPEFKPRTRYLSRDEYDRLIAAAVPHIAALVRFAVATGLRREEQFSLRRENLDLDLREVLVMGTKSGTHRTVPLTDEVLGALEAFPPHRRSPYVFWKLNGARYMRCWDGFKTAV